MEDLVAATGLKMQLTEPDEVAQYALAGVKRQFLVDSESADADKLTRERVDCILARGTPALAVEAGLAAIEKRPRRSFFVFRDLFPKVS